MGREEGRGRERERERERGPEASLMGRGSEAEGWGPVFIRVIYPNEASFWPIFNFEVFEKK